MSCPPAAEGALADAAAQGDKPALQEEREERAAVLVEVREAQAAALVTREARVEAPEAKEELVGRGVGAQAAQAVAAMVVRAALAELQVRQVSPAGDSQRDAALLTFPAPASWHSRRAAMVRVKTPQEERLAAG
jgi:hypothetical protein